eukprot:1156538-Pelagomonas_calceolata.AAC.1
MHWIYTVHAANIQTCHMQDGLRHHNPRHTQHTYTHSSLVHTNFHTYVRATDPQAHCMSDGLGHHNPRHAQHTHTHTAHLRTLTSTHMHVQQIPGVPHARWASAPRSKACSARSSQGGPAGAYCARGLHQTHAISGCHLRSQ